MRYIILFVLIISLSSCELFSQDINIPDKIEINNISNKVDLKGTKVLIDKSVNYQYYPELKRFQKDSKNYFQIIEIANQNYYNSVPNVINKINELEKQGGKVRVKKELKLGIYDAYFGLAPQGQESEQIVLAFGDTSFVVLVVGVFENNDKERKEITDLVLSIYYDKSIKADLNDNLFYNVDLQKSEFKLSNVMSNYGIYTLGKEQLTDKTLYLNNFFIGTLPNKLQNFDIKVYSDNLISKYQNNIFKEKNIKIKIISEQQYKEDGNEIIKVEMIGIYQGKELKMYQYIKESSKGVIQFIGTDISKNYMHISEYKLIAESIKFK
ncbi:hypothetical protein [Flavobacterium sp. DG2-3]|uniref:hypothetical protein n=1 Tax=Flavobacterium sp. DG2-3 TaxID=3068317 RepID=UPI00273F8775|nr:hypothetical protein [Flavobacterium sp. DG2-3]MDP5200590.1 hypothetical protein [Flavobacterium sp. DG2-3]